MSGSYAFPKLADATETSEADLDAMLVELKEAAPGWVAASLDERIALLERVMADTAAVADAWVADACTAKGVELGSDIEWEETYGGPALVVRNARLLRNSLIDIRDLGAPRPPGPITQRADGQTVVRVFPTDGYDKALFGGITGEVWMEPGINPGNLKAAMAKHYRPGGAPEPAVCLVLGAGNVSSIGPMDVLYQLFYELRVCLLKTNPVNDYLAPHWAAAFDALIDAGLVRITTGGVEVGQYLTNHDDVDAIHITGSDKTYDAIVFGTGEEGKARKEADDPINTKPITAELGNVSPVIIVPGPWTDEDIRFQAAHVAGSLVNNGGFNCNASRVIITHKHWNRREAFLQAVIDALDAHPERIPYYPGAEDRWESFRMTDPECHVIGTVGEGCVPWTLIEDIDPEHGDHLVFNQEAFCGVFAETSLDVERDVSTFVREAVRFCNETLWGTLSATVIAHPASLADETIGAAIDQGIADLRYGAIGLNVWSALSYGAVSTTWGAFPGHHRADIQSGNDVVHNSYLFDHPQKSVVRGPFRAWPTPMWHAGSSMSGVARKLVDFEADPKPWKVPGVLAAALR